MRYDIFAHEAEIYRSLSPDSPDLPDPYYRYAFYDPYYRRDVHLNCYTPKSLCEIVDFSRFLALPMAPRTHTVSFTTKLCDCLDSSYHASVMKRLGKKACSDMTIKCHGRAYHANRNVVCRKSSFFNRAMNGYFKVSTRTACLVELD
jgi:hypothetical protein